MQWIFQRFFFPYVLCDIARIQCSACSGFAVRHSPDSVCDMLRIMQTEEDERREKVLSAVVGRIRDSLARV